MNDSANIQRPNFFLSYSHKDMDQVIELNDCLELHGFDVRRDREDLFPGEKFEPRLATLISESETTVLFLTRNWLASEHCRKEFQLAEEAGRRIIPVVAEPVDPNEMPPSIATRHFVFLHGDGEAFARGVANLINTLTTDIEWVREQTRLQTKVKDWKRANQSSSLLLRGEVLVQAEKWISQPAPEHVGLLPEVADFITASQEQARLEDRRSFRGRIITAVMSAGLLMSALGAWVFYERGERIDAQSKIINAEFAEREAISKAEAEAAIAEAEAAKAEAAEAKAKAAEAEAEAIRLAAQAEFNAAVDTYEDGTQVTADAAVRIKTAAAGAIARPRTRSLSVPTEQSAEDLMVAKMNSTDKPTRLSAGAEVAAMVRGKGNEAVLEALVRAIESPTVDDLTSTGRFNTLYMLNVQPEWAGTVWAPRIEDALQRMEELTFVGNQTQGCINTLRAKVQGASDVPNVCGNVNNYFDKGK